MSGKYISVVFDILKGGGWRKGRESSKGRKREKKERRKEGRKIKEREKKLKVTS